MQIRDFNDLTVATPTPEQYADARAYVTRCAPDLVEAIFGSEA